MIEKLGRKKYNIYAFDVESHNDPESIKKKETSIWLASFINDESKIDDAKKWLKDNKLEAVLILGKED